MVGDQFVARRWKGKYVIAAVPQFPEDREWSEAQLSQQLRFREAVSYGRAMLQVPEMLEIYEAEAEGRDLTPFNAAVRDYPRDQDKEDAHSRPTHSNILYKQTRWRGMRLCEVVL